MAIELPPSSSHAQLNGKVGPLGAVQKQFVTPDEVSPKRKSSDEYGPR